MPMICERCGIGRRDFGGLCDWCAAPARTRLPFWIVTRRWVERSLLAARLRRRGAIATGMAAGIFIHLLAAVVGVIFGVPHLWQSGFLWSQQWWWALVPEAWQPWLFAAARGAAYGALAGGVAAAGKRTRDDRAPGRRRGGGNRPAGPDRLPVSPSPRLPVSPSPATVTALVAFAVSAWEPEVGTQYQLVAAALGAAVGRLTTMMLRER